ncbi:MAG: hypothetical protein K9N55_10650 [Phycisphaerae bacterium]|nr:hypothetical protein [Phycisphaerae bacterium]
MSYKDQVEFIIVYVREAHPEMLREAHPTGVVGRPKDIQQRVILATECVTKFQFTIPMVIDGMNGQVNEDYKAAPVRVAITDLEGKIVYYAGQGPRDFRLSAVERVLKRLVANQGRVPAPPEPTWGSPEKGLRCGIVFDPPAPRIDDDVVVRLQFQNVTKNSLGVILPTENLLQSMVLTDDREHRLMIRPAGSESSQSKRYQENAPRQRNQVYEIKPGDSLFYDLYGNVIPAAESSPAGNYHIQCSLTVASGTVPQLARFKNAGHRFPLWTGQVKSGATLVKVGESLAGR